MFKSIQARILWSFAALSIATALPISWLFYDALRSVLSIQFDVETTKALSDAVQLSAELLDGHKRRCVERSRLLVESSAFRNTIRRLQRDDSRIRAMDSLRAILEPRRWSMHAIALVDADGKPVIINTVDIPSSDVSTSLTDSAFQQAAAKSQGLYADYDVATGFLRVAATVLIQPSDYRIYTMWRLPADLRSRLDQIVKAHRLHETLQSQKQEIMKTFLLSFVIAYSLILSLTLVIALVVSGRLSRPVDRLLLATERFARGDLDYRIPPEPRHDEIGRLIGSFNTMIEQIKRHQEERLHLEKVTAWREIAQRMAHEIKNPLTPIQLGIQQVKDAYKGTDEGFREQLNISHEIICEEIESLRRLTGEFSEFARLPQISPKIGDINELIQDIVKLYPLENITLTLAEDLRQLEFDRDGIKRVLMNLIENGLRAISGRPDGAIHIATYEDKEYTTVVIRDNGCGIPKHDLSRIFEPHFSTKSAGMGLGLAITKAIIEEHHGTIDVDSVENQGTVFHMKLVSGHPLNLF